MDAGGSLSWSAERTQKAWLLSNNGETTNFLNDAYYGRTYYYLDIM
jgi:hypothetical protein